MSPRRASPKRGGVCKCGECMENGDRGFQNGCSLTIEASLVMPLIVSFSHNHRSYLSHPREDKDKGHQRLFLVASPRTHLNIYVS